MKNDAIANLEALWLKIIFSSYALSFLDEVKAIADSAQNIPQHRELELKSKMLLSAIYEWNGLLEQSWELDLFLLEHFPLDYFDYYNLVGRAMQTAVSLDKMQDIYSFVYQFLTQSTSGWGAKIPVLDWYSEFCWNDYPHHQTSLEPVLNEIAAGIGAELKTSHSFTEKVDYLLGEWNRANQDLHEFMLIYKKAPLDEKPDLLAVYFQSEHLKFYINYVNRYIV